MSSSNLPNKLRDIPVFIGNPWVRVINLLDDVEIVEPVTAEVWFSGVNHPEIAVVPVVDGQTITVALTPEQIALLPSRHASLNIKFGSQYVFQQKLTPTYEGAIPEDVVEEYETPGLGIFRVSYYSDETNAKNASEAALLATDGRLKAEKAAEDAYDYMIAAQNASVGVADPAGTFNASTGVATQDASATNSAQTFTPTAVSNKPKGYFLTVSVAGTTSISGSSVSAKKGDTFRSNGVGFGWTYIPASDAGYQIASDLSNKLPVRNLFNASAATSGQLMTSSGGITANAGYATSEKIPIKPSTQYTGSGPNPLLMRYACFFAANGTTVVSGGWDGVSTATFTSPATAYYVVITITVGDLLTFQLEEGSVANTHLDYGIQVGNGGIKIKASDVLPDSSNQFVTGTEKSTISTLTPLSTKFVKANLANPDNFVDGQIIQASGVPASNASFTNTGLVPVTAGEQYICDSDLGTGCRYACFFAANGTTVIAGGWNGVNTTSFTAPAGAFFFVGTFSTTGIGSFRVVHGTVDPGFVLFDSYLTSEVVTPAGNVLTNEDRLFVTQTQIDTWSTASSLGEKFHAINLADPSLFTSNALIQSSGIPVTSAVWVYTGKIPVTPGETISMNSDGNTGSRYACFFAANGTTVVSGGWDGVNTFTKVVPAGAYFIAASFPSLYASSVRVAVGSVDPGNVPYGYFYSDEVFMPAESITESTNKRFVTDAEKTTISTISYLDSQFEQLELKGILQKSFTAPSPIYKDIEEFVKVLLQGDEDILAEEDNGSISTGVAGYCSPTANSNLLPEFCREENLWTKWVRYMLKRYFPGQKHARFDTAGVFTIGGSYTQVATNADVNWGHQYPNGGDDFGGPNPSGQVFFDRYYQIITPTSGDVSVSFYLPDSSYKLAWILSHSHLTGTLTFSVAGGNNRLEYETTTPGVWAELNGATWDTSTPDAFDAVAFGTSTKIRRDQHSMPFKVRRKEGFTISGSILITATMGGGKRIEHWGVYHTRANNLFIPVCSAKGSHNLESLRAFYPYGIDKRKPNLYIMGCPTINEWRVSTTDPTDTPSAYAARFTSHATTMLGKSHVKAIYARIRWVHLNMNMYEASGDMPTYYKTSEGYNNGFDYISKMIREMHILKDANPGKMAVVNLLPAYLNYTKALAEFNGSTMREALYIAGGAATESPTMDQTHEGNCGNEQGYRADVNNWNF